MSSEEIMISGAGPCSGSIQISGAKNAALPEMAACLLTDKQVILTKVPAISDIDVMKKQLQSYGVQVNDATGSGLHIQATGGQTKLSPSSSEGSKTRGSFLVLGPLLARFGEAKVYYPGGCQIGSNGRPVNFHIEALQQMGATASESACGKYVTMKAVGGLTGAQIHFPNISVGATENIVMAACLARGQTVITNAAVEPEVTDLIEMLKAMGMNGNIGVDESGNEIVVNGRGGTLLNDCTHAVIPDRIEAGTWAIAAAITGGNLLLKMDPVIGEKIMKPVTEKLINAGVEVTRERNGLKVQRPGQINPVNVTTGPFPNFPTDLLPLWVILMTQANGISTVEDSIYDDRFKHIPQLEIMGAMFTRISSRKYKVHGKVSLRGARVVASDLRAGAALVLAALVAGGTTVVKEFQHVLRGYENIREKLKCWGVQFHPLPQSRPGFHGGNSCSSCSRR